MRLDNARLNVITAPRLLNRMLMHSHARILKLLFPPREKNFYPAKQRETDASSFFQLKKISRLTILTSI